MTRLQFLFIVSLLLSCITTPALYAQINVELVKEKIESYKADSRGPYKDIRWFCADGTNVAPKDTCKGEGAFQRARYKDELISVLWQQQSLYLGQILKGTDKQEFLDAENQHTRVKHYLIEQYLKDLDDGWIHRKSQYYRGAVQSEDEAAWGKEFLEWLLSKENHQAAKFYLYRELVKYIPHGEENNTLSKIRSISKAIADRHSSFMDIRTKIHGNLQEKDIALVESYISNKASGLEKKSQTDLTELKSYMEIHFRQDLGLKLKPATSVLKTDSRIFKEIDYFLNYAKDADSEELLVRGSDLLADLKNRIQEDIGPRERLALFDISIILEQYLLGQLSSYNPESLESELSMSCYLSQTLNATGYLYDWEFEELLFSLTTIPQDKILLSKLHEVYRNVLRSINWSSALIQMEFGDQMELFSSFEPMAHGFMDDRIRSSALLLLGRQASRYNEYISEKANWKNKIFGKSRGSIQGINPGYAKGRLVLVDNPNEVHSFDPAAVYVFRKSPADLEPVAGILSISEGNVVSHLQLLARNLGIPNANITEELYSQLKSYNGKEIFYAVSNRGGVLMKSVDEMNSSEKALFAKKSIDEQIMRVPTESLNLDDVKVYTLEEIDVASSGILCGPKAANFARLKKLFPDQLVDGLVIPFSVFKDHMDQTIPNQDQSYWDFLSQTFTQISDMKSQGSEPADIEKYTLQRLSELRSLILEMSLKQEFIRDLKNKFVSTLGQDLGKIPVFLRSDTNMEDLKDFTGAGLNLTLFNTLDEKRILDGIKEVWASPYTERSYRWRQKFLLNPEDVYPSILIIPSVFVDYSGVVITKDFVDGKPGRYNVAFSQGAGGAVDGQKAESWILSPNGQNILVSPARDMSYKYLSKSGGTGKAKSAQGQRILSNANISDLWRICQSIERQMPQYGMQYPYDIELGFENDKLWLFQIRPFVENKSAVASSYLNALDPELPQNLQIKLNEKMSV